MGAAAPDIREGGAILEVQMDYINDDLSTECRIGGDIIESNVTEGILSLPPVEFKGFQHLYKSTETTSSQGVLAAHKTTIKHSVPCNDHSRRRDQEKEKNALCRERYTITPSYDEHEK
jgi:hypothetical protein